MTVAIVIGGAENVLDEYKRARQLCIDAGDLAFATFVVNDMIALFPDHIDFAITLHPIKLEVWLRWREDSVLWPPGKVYSCTHDRGVTHTTSDWTGSSGLFAVKVALEEGFNKVLLCGVPMDPKMRHFKRQVPWPSAERFRERWEPYMKTIKLHARSFSGWTAEQLGTPSIEFLRS
jgi:hypothetical protein